MYFLEQTFDKYVIRRRYCEEFSLGTFRSFDENVDICISNVLVYCSMCRRKNTEKFENRDFLMTIFFPSLFCYSIVRARDVFHFSRDDDYDSDGIEDAETRESNFVFFSTR